MNTKGGAKKSGTYVAVCDCFGCYRGRRASKGDNEGEIVRGVSHLMPDLEQGGAKREVSEGRFAFGKRGKYANRGPLSVSLRYRICVSDACACMPGVEMSEGMWVLGSF